MKVQQELFNLGLNLVDYPNELKEVMQLLKKRNKVERVKKVSSTVDENILKTVELPINSNLKVSGIVLCKVKIDKGIYYAVLTTCHQVFSSWDTFAKHWTDKYHEENFLFPLDKSLAKFVAQKYAKEPKVRNLCYLDGFYYCKYDRCCRYFSERVGYCSLDKSYSKRPLRSTVVLSKICFVDENFVPQKMMLPHHLEIVE